MNGRSLAVCVTALLAVTATLGQSRPVEQPNSQSNSKPSHLSDLPAAYAYRHPGFGPPQPMGLQIAIWEDGTVLFAEDAEKPGENLRVGKVTPERVSKMLVRLGRAGFFDDLLTGQPGFADVAMVELGARWKKQRGRYSLPAASDAALERHVTDEADYRRFKTMWDSARREISQTRPTESSPIDVHLDSGRAFRGYRLDEPRQTKWLSYELWLPSQVHPGDSESAAIALFRAYQDQPLSHAQIERLFDQALTADPNLDLRSPYPQGTKAAAFLKVNFNAPGSLHATGLAVFEDKTSILVDGKPVATSGKAPQIALIEAGEDELTCYIPPLKAGQRRVSVTKMLTVRRLDDPQGAAPLHSWTLSAAAAVRVEGRAASEYIKTVSSPELAESIQKSLQVASSLSITRDDPYYRPAPCVMFVQATRPPVAIVAEVWVRPSGNGPYIHVANFVAHKDRFETDRVVGTTQRLLLKGKIDGVEEVTHVDVRLVPNGADAAKQALLEGIDECYGDTIERLKVPLVTEEPRP